MRRTIIVLLALVATIGIPLSSSIGQPPLKTVTPALPTRSESAHHYQVVFRVVQPVWRRTPSAGKQLEPKFTAILEDGFILTTPVSDEQFLQTLNRANPTFRFDKVLRRFTATLQADTRFVLPDNFSIHEIWLAIVEKDRRLFQADPSSARYDLSQQSIIDQNKKSGTTTPYHPLSYKCGFKEEDLRRLYGKGKVVLSFNAKQFFSEGDSKLPHMTSDSCQIMDNGATVCLTRNLPVKITPNGSARLMPNDCVFITVTRN